MSVLNTGTSWDPTSGHSAMPSASGMETLRASMDCLALDFGGGTPTSPNIGTYQHRKQHGHAELQQHKCSRPTIRSLGRAAATPSNSAANTCSTTSSRSFIRAIAVNWASWTFGARLYRSSAAARRIAGYRRRHGADFFLGLPTAFGRGLSSGDLGTDFNNRFGFRPGYLARLRTTLL